MGLGIKLGKIVHNRKYRNYNKYEGAYSIQNSKLSVHSSEIHKQSAGRVSFNQSF